VLEVCGIVTLACPPLLCRGLIFLCDVFSGPELPGELAADAAGADDCDCALTPAVSRMPSGSSTQAADRIDMSIISR
jgi:hypothetical protein